MNSACVDIMEYPETHLRSISNTIYLAEAEVIFNQSMNRARYDSNSGPVQVGKLLIYGLSAHISRHALLITDLLPELVKLELFDLQMQAVLRRKWIMIESIVDSWFGEKRTLECLIPRWLVKDDFGCLRNGN